MRPARRSRSPQAHDAAADPALPAASRTVSRARTGSARPRLMLRSAVRVREFSLTLTVRLWPPARTTAARPANLPLRTMRSVPAQRVSPAGQLTRIATTPLRALTARVAIATRGAVTSARGAAGAAGTAGAAGSGGRGRREVDRLGLGDRVGRIGDGGVRAGAAGVRLGRVVADVGGVVPVAAADVDLRQAAEPGADVDRVIAAERVDLERLRGPDVEEEQAEVGPHGGHAAVVGGDRRSGRPAAAPLSCATSLPAPPSNTSEPSPLFQISVSSPSPPFIVSLPRAPTIVSLPSPPLSVSLPSVPVICRCRRRR